jgi:NADPH-dependent curcumin reductase CurA
MTSLVPPFSLPDLNRRVLLTRRPVSTPQAGDFTLDAVAPGNPSKGQVLVRNIYLSVDPAQRGWASNAPNYSAPVALGDPMRALAVGVVVDSRTPELRVGDFVYGWFDWQDYAVVDASLVLVKIVQPAVPLSAYAGILGINGITAFLALTMLGRPAEGETILVSTAAGAVGSVVGQLARDAGCRVLGLAGTDEKVNRSTMRFGYDAAWNYRRENIEEALKQQAPDGLDIYFDNVGGATLDAAIRHMRPKGRIIQCGTASIKTWSPAPRGRRNEREILARRLTWSGFIIFDHLPEFAGAAELLTDMILSERLVHDEDIDVGIEAAPAAIGGVYAGVNQGKKLIYIG